MLLHSSMKTVSQCNYNMWNEQYYIPSCKHCLWIVFMKNVFSFFFFFFVCMILLLVLNCLQVCCQSIVIMLMLWHFSANQISFTWLLRVSWLVLERLSKCCHSQRAYFNLPTVLFGIILDPVGILIEETLVNVGAWANHTEPDERFLWGHGWLSQGTDALLKTPNRHSHMLTEVCVCPCVFGSDVWGAFPNPCHKPLLLLLWLLLPVKNVTHMCYKSMFRMF